MRSVSIRENYLQNLQERMSSSHEFYTTSPEDSNPRSEGEFTAILGKVTWSNH